MKSKRVRKVINVGNEVTLLQLDVNRVDEPRIIEGKTIWLKGFIQLEIIEVSPFTVDKVEADG